MKRLLGAVGLYVAGTIALAVYARVMKPLPPTYCQRCGNVIPPRLLYCPTCRGLVAPMR